MKSYFAYIRVSTAKQGHEGSSLQEQRAAIEAFAQRKNFIISEWFEDRETAAKKGRTQFVRMMTRLEKGAATGLLIHKIDRGARNFWDWARIQNFLDSGREVHFVHDNLDMSSRGGRLAADIQAVVAADYVRNLREEVKKGQHGRLKQGLYPFGAPLGYLNNGKGTVKTIDPIKGPLVRSAFELYASKRHSFHTLRAELHRVGLRRRGGGPLSLCSITAMLRNPFYTGMIRMKGTGELFKGVHEPLISAPLFRRVQNVLDGKLSKRPIKHEFLYRRLFKCGLCHLTLIGERQKGIVYYRCHTPTCTTKGIREDVITSYLLHSTERMRFSDEEIPDLISMIEEDQEANAKAKVERLKAAGLQIGALEERERRLTDLYIDQHIGREAYQSRQAALILELADARAMYEEILSDGDGIIVRIKAFFEFLRSLRVETALAFSDKFREALIELTSNRSVVGKDPFVTIQSPFRELISELPILRCAPHRDRPRTRTGVSTGTEDVSLRHQRRHIIRVMRKHLKDWQPPAWAMVEEVKVKRQPPRNPYQQEEDRLAA